jgi:hypothetical protein
MLCLSQRRVTPATAPTEPFPPLLVELVRADAPAQMLRDEGFSSFEVTAVRALVARERALQVAALGSDAQTVGGTAGPP